MIFPSRSLEPDNTRIHRAFLNSDQVQRIYLDELGDPAQQPLGISLMQLTTPCGYLEERAPEDQAATQAKVLIQRTREEAENLLTREAIIEVIATIAVYKFTNFSREEVEAMLGLQLEDSRILREAKAEGEREKALALALRLLARRMGQLDDFLQARVQELSSGQLEDLSEALLDFTSLADLMTWLDMQLDQENRPSD